MLNLTCDETTKTYSATWPTLHLHATDITVERSGHVLMNLRATSPTGDPLHVGRVRALDTREAEGFARHCTPERVAQHAVVVMLTTFGDAVKTHLQAGMATNGVARAAPTIYEPLAPELPRP